MDAKQQREQRIAEGLGLIASGTTLRDAAELVGIPHPTLARYRHKLGFTSENKDLERKRMDETLLASAYCVADQALARMSEEVNQADHRSLVAFADASVRVLGRLRGWDRGLTQDAPGERWLSAVERIAAQGGSVEVRVTGAPIEQPLTIDVGTDHDE